MSKQKGKICSKLGRILWNWQNIVNRNNEIIHLSRKHWLRIIKTHPDLGLRFDDVCDAIDYYDKRNILSKGKRRYVKHFPDKPSVEIVAIYDEGEKYCVIHVLELVGKIISFKAIRRP